MQKQIKTEVNKSVQLVINNILKIGTTENTLTKQLKAISAEYLPEAQALQANDKAEQAITLVITKLSKAVDDINYQVFQSTALKDESAPDWKKRIKSTAMTKALDQSRRNLANHANTALKGLKAGHKFQCSQSKGSNDFDGHWIATFNDGTEGSGSNQKGTDTRKESLNEDLKALTSSELALGFKELSLQGQVAFFKAISSMVKVSDSAIFDLMQASNQTMINHAAEGIKGFEKELKKARA